MVKSKSQKVVGHVLLWVGILMLVFQILGFLGGTKAHADVLEKLKLMFVYSNDESIGASTISGFNNGGTPGLMFSSSKVVIGDSLYVGPSSESSSRVLTEKDLESIKQDIREQIYKELEESGRLK